MADLELSWIESLGQWRKRYKGKTYYLGTGKGRRDLDSYRRAFEKWEATKSEIDRAARIVLPNLDPLKPNYEMWRDMLAFRPGRDPAEYLPKGMKPEEMEWRRQRVEQMGIDRERAAATTSTGKTMADHLTDYIADQQRRYEHGLAVPDAPQSERISAQRFIAYRHHADRMRAAWGDQPLPKSEGELARLLTDFKNQQRSELTAKAITASTYNERIKTLRHFVGWLHDGYLIDAMPRKIGDICAKYKVQPSAKAIDLDVIRQMWGAADDVLRTYMALALNCGFYAVDLAHLTPANVRGGHIHYDRHKTGVPTRFKLWSVTRELLNRLPVAPDRPHLFEHKGQQIVTVDVKGKGQRKSHPDQKLYVICRRLKLKGITFSQLRDTSSTLIEGIDRTLTDIFDGHRDGRMARFYVDRDAVDHDRLFAPLDKATDELETMYGLDLSPP